MPARATPSARRLFRLGHLFNYQFGSPQPIYTDSTRNLNWLLGGAMECVLKHLATSCFVKFCNKFFNEPSCQRKNVPGKPFLIFSTAHLDQGTCHISHPSEDGTAGGSWDWHVKRKLPSFSFVHFSFCPFFFLLPLHYLRKA